MILPGEFLDVAEELYSEDNDEEGKFRTSISRAYYSAFHTAQQKVIEKTVFRSSDGLFENHQHFISQLQRDPDLSDFKGIGKQLHRLKKLRFKADYDIDEEVTRNEVKSSLSTARSIASRCDSL